MQDEAASQSTTLGFRRGLVGLHAGLGAPLGLAFAASVAIWPEVPILGLPGVVLGTMGAGLGVWVSTNAARRLKGSGPALLVSQHGVRCNHLIGLHKTWAVPWDKVTGVFPSRHAVVLRVDTEALPSPRLGAVGRLLRKGFKSRSLVHVPTACVAGGQAHVLAAIRKHAPSVSVWQSHDVVKKRGLSVDEVLEFLGL